MAFRSSLIEPLRYLLNDGYALIINTQNAVCSILLISYERDGGDHWIA